jgi:uncharacterized surface protein with fasciclin (FAS1) repeats
MFKKILHSSLLFGLSFVFLAACSENPMQSQSDDGVMLIKDKVSKKMGPPEADNTIVDIASSVEGFEILTQAVIFAGLADELDGRRQFTVFAPTNAAFEALLSELGITAGELLSEGNEELVKSILLYHVAPGERFAEDILGSDRVNTLLKEFAFVEGATIGNDKYGFANIDATDIDASNGVIHVIDAVLLQPSLEL